MTLVCILFQNGSYGIPKSSPGAQKLFWHKCRRLDTVAFCFLVLVNVLASFIGMSFLSAVHVLDRSFLVMQSYGNVCNWFPQLIWRMNWFCSALVGLCFNWSTFWLHGLKYASINFWRNQVFSVVWRVFWFVI